MNIVVCIKIVQGEINPFDAAALETALRLDGAQITVVSMGPKNTLSALKALTRLGDFRTILISDDIFAGSDTLATSRTLSAAIRQLDPILIFCGRQSVDGETAQVGPCTAEMLGFSFVGNVLEFGGTKCRTRTGEENIISPALLTFERICDLRFPSLKSKVRDVDVWNNDRIGLDPSLCGLAGSPTRVLETFQTDHGHRHCTFIEADELEPLLEKLRRNPVAKSFSGTAPNEKESKERLKTVWAVGPEVRLEAERIGENVVEQSRDRPENIAELARAERPDAILWNADFWGRNTAPRIAALLKTGLCADCTKLSVVVENGKKTLEMYRPALGGNVIARIRCRLRPVMATVRIANETYGMIVSCGRGAVGLFEKISRFAERFDAEIAASRGLVDTGVAPYEIQVGLTGKHVSPDIYLALGISGTIQHLCAVENAGTIVAVNSDKNARIFEYADYGVVDKVENVIALN